MKWNFPAGYRFRGQDGGRDSDVTLTLRLLYTSYIFVFPGLPHFALLFYSIASPCNVSCLLVFIRVTGHNRELKEDVPPSTFF